MDRPHNQARTGGGLGQRRLPAGAPAGPPGRPALRPPSTPTSLAPSARAPQPLQLAGTPAPPALRHFGTSALRHFAASSIINPVRVAIDARKPPDFGIGTDIRNIVRQLARLDG